MDILSAKILLHHYSHSARYHERDSTLSETYDYLYENNLIIYELDKNNPGITTYSLTDKGVTLVNYWLQTPLPVKQVKWIISQQKEVTNVYLER
jgi:hypothetical protein